jgi:hypothetical protein
MTYSVVVFNFDGIYGRVLTAFSDMEYFGRAIIINFHIHHQWTEDNPYGLP